ncbi:hypothetical protein DRE_01004 [Drechslerella stenobrocha 248]|uniref:SET domain-containing protein n=1 Tax=Drechslerella stenobrocha 248 TaxID=1043628 RepID=W7I7J1_9PEZI|nr:hypothetical protein DRE_01004 [Drechslerella stenobrocha 248]
MAPHPSQLVDGPMGGRVLQLTTEERQHLFMQQMLAEQARAITGQKPRVKHTLAQLLTDLNSRTLDTDGFCVNNTAYRSVEFDTMDSYLPSRAGISQLTEIRISNLTIETRHRGRYIVVQVAGDAKVLTCVNVVVEGCDGRHTQMQVYNLPRWKTYTQMFLKGQVVLVKEPFYKVSSTGIPSLRVDHFSDMVFLEGGDNLMPGAWSVGAGAMSAAACEGLGNLAMTQGIMQMNEAIRWYTKGLQRGPDAALKVSLLLNRCMARLYREEFELAVRDCDGALAIDEHNEKALFRKSRALYFLGDFKRSGNALMRILKRNPTSVEAKQELVVMRKRVMEELTGNYNFTAMVKLARENQSALSYDFADYTVPVQVGASKVSGRGLFTKKDVKAGDLLCCCRAFVNCHEKDNGISLKVNTQELTVTRQPGAHVAEFMLDKLRRIPSLLPEVMRLCNHVDPGVSTGGQAQPEVVNIENPIIDSFIIKDIARINGFSSHSYFDEFPGLRPASAASWSQRRPRTEENPFDPNAGIWILPSFANHSCVPNARHVIIGDMFVLRAAIDMPEDTEILISYTDPSLDFERRQTMLKTSWGFTCTCDLCHCEHMSATGPAKETRDQALHKIEEIMTRMASDGPTVEDAQTLKEEISALEKGYMFPATVVPRPVVGAQLLRLYSYYVALGMQQEAIAALHAVPGAFGALFDFIEGELQVFHLGWPHPDLVMAYARLAATTGLCPGPVADGWMNVAKTAYKIVAGEDETFEETFGELFAKIQGEGRGEVERMEEDTSA